METKYLRIVILVIAIWMTFSGCSSQVMPVIPDTPEPANKAADNTQPDRVLWGLYSLIFDPVTLQVSVEPLRVGDIHVNVTSFVIPPQCTDCLGIQVQGFNPTGYVYSVMATLRNPTTLTAYDVRGTLLIGGITDKRKLVNVDDYTEQFDNSTPPDRNPFKIFAFDQPGSIFEAGATHKVLYQVSIPPPPNFQVLYVIDASWPLNQKDPYRIREQVIDAPLDDAGVTSAGITVFIDDWQGDVESVRLDVTPLGASEKFELTHQAGPKWVGELQNSWGAEAGDYTLWLEAKSSGSPFTLYDKIVLNIVEYQNQGPEWDTTIGVQGLTPLSGSMDVTFGTASDTNPPVTYNVYYSETSPIDFGTTPKKNVASSPANISELDNGKIYYFAVRAMDGFGLEDVNTVELPGSPNLPPGWDTTIGVQGLTPLSQSLQVSFGTASDPDVPVTYNIYYSLTTPIDFGTTPSINVASSPGIIPGLDNSKTYYAAVRAMDVYGLEEQNSVEIAGSPNLPPQWTGQVGIIKVTGGFGLAMVYFATATDPDSPVTYNVYYSKTSPINFSTAYKVTGLTSSPVKIKSLDNEETYYFAVRAQDSLGLEDTNTNEAAATTWALPGLKWSHSFGGVVFSSPSYADLNNDGIDDIVAGSWANNVEALDGKTGDALWTYETGDWVDSSPCIVEVGGKKGVLIGSYDAKLHAIYGDTGLEAWTFPTGGTVSSSPAAVDIDNDGSLETVFGSFDGKVYSVEMDSSQDWFFNTYSENFSSPALIDDDNDGHYSIFIGGRNGYLYSLDYNGGLNWQYQSNDQINSSPAVGDIDGDGSPEVVFASMDGTVYALTMGGALEWQFDVGGYIWASPALGDFDGDGALEVAIGADNSNFYLIDGLYATEKWHFPSGGRIWSSAALADMSGDGILDVVVGSNDGYLWCLDGENGHMLWSYNSGAWIDSSPAIADLDHDNNMEIIFGCADGFVYCLESNAPQPAPGLLAWSKFRNTLDNRGVAQ